MGANDPIAPIGSVTENDVIAAEQQIYAANALAAARTQAAAQVPVTENIPENQITTQLPLPNTQIIQALEQNPQLGMGLPVAPYLFVPPEAVRNTRPSETDLEYSETGLYGATNYRVQPIVRLKNNEEDNQGSPSEDFKTIKQKKLRMTL